MSSLGSGIVYGSALFSSVLCTLGGYYYTCKYADLACHFQSQGLKTQLSHICSTDRGTLIKLVFTLLCSLALEVFALAVLPLIIVAPLSMLFFVYAAVYSVVQSKWVDKNAPIDNRFVIVAVFIVIFIGLAMYSGADYESALVILDVDAKATFSTSSTIYFSCFAVLIIGLYLFQRSTSAMGSFCNKVGAETADLNTILKGSLTGIVRGQTVVLIKLVAEQIEHMLREPSGENTTFFILFALTLVLMFLHLLAFHNAFSSLQQQNVELLMPVYRSTFMASALIGAALFLQEFESIKVQSSLLYTIAITSLIFICVLLSFIATSHYYITETKHTRIETLQTDTTQSDDFAIMDRMENAAQTSPDRTRALTLGSPKQGETSGLWNLNLWHSEEVFSLAKSRTSFKSGFSNLRSRSKSAPWMVKGGPKPKVDPLIALITCKDNKKFNYDYPESCDTMVVKQGNANPHADGQNSSWVDPGSKAGQWKIRGYNYLNDGKKIDAEEARMKVVAVDWRYCPKSPVVRMGELKGGYVQKNHANRTDRPFMFIVNFMVPGVGNQVNYFVKKADCADTVFDQMLVDFIQAKEDSYRKARFKFIPAVIEGSYIVKKTVGSKPTLLCKKLDSYFFRGENYYEVTIDVGSSKVARSIMGAVKGFATTLVLQFGYLLESKSKEQLPERVLGGVQLHRPVMTPWKGSKVPPLLHAKSCSATESKDMEEQESEESGDEGYQTA